MKKAQKILLGAAEEVLTGRHNNAVGAFSAVGGYANPINPEMESEARALLNYFGYPWAAHEMNDNEASIGFCLAAAMVEHA